MLDPSSQKSSVLYLKCTKPLTSRQNYVLGITPLRFSNDTRVDTKPLEC
jgi:hypothetical protein